MQSPTPGQGLRHIKPESALPEDNYKMSEEVLIPPRHHSQNTEHRPCFLFLVQHYSLPKNFCTSPTPTDPPRSAQSPDRCYFSPSSHYPQLCSLPSIPPPLGSLSSPTTPNLPLHSPRSCGGGFLSGLLSVGPHVVLVPMPHTLYHHFSPPPPPPRKKTHSKILLARNRVGAWRS